jgi:hypothetical protein
MNTHTTQTGAGDSAAQNIGAISAALSDWAKLVRKDCGPNPLLNVDHWLLTELAILFKKLALQAPERALQLLAEESRSVEQSILIGQDGGDA